MATKKKKPPSFSSWKSSGYGSAANIAALQEQMAGYATDYNTLSQQATAAYTPTYNANLLALQQQLETQLGGYSNQLSGLSLTYDKQRRNLNSQYDQSLNSAMNNLTKRGIGRSSIVGTTSAAIEGARGQALDDVGAAETDAYEDIYSNIALAQNQYAASDRQLRNDYAAQIESRINELRNTNQTAQTQLQLQIAQLQQSGYQQYLNWYYKYGPGKKKSSSRSSKKSSSSSAGSKTSTPSNGTADALAGNNPPPSKPSTSHKPPTHNDLYSDNPYAVTK